MSKFRILRVDHYDPAAVGKRNRFLYAVYGIIPTLFLLSFNFGDFTGLSYGTRLMISVPVLGLIYFLLLKKIRSSTDNLRTIGELEITQSCLKKKIGDSSSEYNFKVINEIRLIKHLPATRIRDSKTGFYSYILKIVFHDLKEESFVVSDRSIDHEHKISIADTIKTLKKLVSFVVIIET